jgi:outer membrane protein
MVCAVSGISFAEVITLEQSYNAALKKDTTVLKNRSAKGQSVARLKQAKSYLFPSINLVGKYEQSTFEEKDTNISTHGTAKTAGAILKQPLFQGGLFSGIQREKALDELTDLQIKQSDLDLYLAVAQSYYKIQILESTLEVVKDVNDVSSKRVGILTKRAKIGKTKQTDVLTNEIQNQELKVELNTVESDLAAEKERFANLTGLSKEVSLQKVLDVPVLKPFSYYSSKADQTLDIAIQNKNVYVAEKNESIKDMQHLPTIHLDLEANYSDYGATSTSRDGNEYSGALVLEMPLFLGGRTSAEAQEAEWKKVEEKNRLTTLKRDISVNITNQYNEFKKWSELYKIYEESLSTARKNYQIFNKESNLGLVSNLELLNSLTSYLDTKKGRDEAFYQLKISELTLARLVGERN